MRGSAHVPAPRGSRSPGLHARHYLGAPGPLPAAREAREAGSAPQTRARSLGSTLPGQVPGRSAWLTGSEGCKPGHGADWYLSSEKRLQVGPAVQAEPGTTCPSRPLWAAQGSATTRTSQPPRTAQCGRQQVALGRPPGPGRKALSSPSPSAATGRAEQGPGLGRSGFSDHLWAPHGDPQPQWARQPRSGGCGGGHGGGLGAQTPSELRAQS